MCKYSHGNEAFVPGMAMGFPMGAAGNGFMPMMMNAAGFTGDNAPYDPTILPSTCACRLPLLLFAMAATTAVLPTSAANNRTNAS